MADLSPGLGRRLVNDVAEEASPPVDGDGPVLTTEVGLGENRQMGEV